MLQFSTTNSHKLRAEKQLLSLDNNVTMCIMWLLHSTLQGFLHSGRKFGVSSVQPASQLLLMTHFMTLNAPSVDVGKVCVKGGVD